MSFFRKKAALVFVHAGLPIKRKEWCGGVPEAGQNVFKWSKMV
jgi:hypothetical protein